MSEQQQRVPSGVPTGGQFSVSEKGEAGISLSRMDGSFLYPPVFTSAEEVIDFWSNVEIPDEVLARAEHLYVTEFEQIRERFPSGAWEGYGQYDWADSNPQPAADDVAATADWEGRKRAAQVDYETHLADALATRPETLNRRDVRPLVRATAMVRTAAEDLDAPDYHAVCAHEVSLTTGSTSAYRAAMESGILGFSGTLLDAERYDLDRPKVVTAEVDGQVAAAAQPEAAPITKEDIRQIVDEVVTKALNEQNVLLDNALDELTDNLGTVGDAVITAVDPRSGKRRGR